MRRPAAVDAGRFEALVREAADPGLPASRTLELLTQALTLWTGAALEGFEHEEWARPDAVRLDELRAQAVDDRAQAELDLGLHEAAVSGLRSAVEARPLRERTRRLLMTALYRSGRQAEALRAYQEYRDRLATDLGLEPGEEIRQLELSVATGSLPTPPPSSDARAVRAYRLLERIGEGAYAVVYRASQPSVDRVVAIKVIRAELADRPEFVRRFEAEAHLVARLEHPHIVPLYDFWREPGSAYLVMRYFRGGTLEQRLSVGCLEAGEAAALATQVGSALAAAHRAGVVHRDVKPGNIFLDGEGNYFLGDFGIAHAPVPIGHASPAAGSSDTGPPVDVYGLGVTVCEALTGQQAFPINGAPLPDGLGPVLTKATAADASARHATVEDLVAECIDVLTGARTSVGGRTGPRPGAAEVRNPYKGLRAFQEADAPDFYGHVRLVGRMIELMAGSTPASRFLTVVGPSGSGKSSAVRAGLIPALRAGAVDGSQRWFLTSMTPGAHPFEELEAALARVAVEPIGQLAELMASGRRGIARGVKQVLADDTAVVVVVVDQFEELFTMCATRPCAGRSSTASSRR